MSKSGYACECEICGNSTYSRKKESLIYTINHIGGMYGKKGSRCPFCKRTNCLRISKKRVQ